MSILGSRLLLLRLGAQAGFILLQLLAETELPLRVEDVAIEIDINEELGEDGDRGDEHCGHTGDARPELALEGKVIQIQVELYIHIQIITAGFHVAGDEMPLGDIELSGSLVDAIAQEVVGKGEFERRASDRVNGLATGVPYNSRTTYQTAVVRKNGRTCETSN